MTNMVEMNAAAAFVSSATVRVVDWRSVFGGDGPGCGSGRGAGHENTEHLERAKRKQTRVLLRMSYANDKYRPPVGEATDGRSVAGDGTERSGRAVRAGSQITRQIKWGEVMELVLFTVRTLPRMRMRQAQENALMWAHKLADEDSYFVPLYWGLPRRIRIHCKVTDPSTSRTIADAVSASVSMLSTTSTKGTPMVKQEDGLILLHGMLGHVVSWARVQTALADMFNVRVVAYDRPGFGLSCRPAAREWESDSRSFGNPYTLQGSVQQLKMLIDSNRLGLSDAPVILCAHSMGCAVALLMASMYPERVKALVLVAPAAQLPRSSSRASPERERENGSAGSGAPDDAASRAGRLVQNLAMRVLDVPVLGRSLIRARFETVLSTPRDRREQLERLFHDVNELADADEYLDSYAKPMLVEQWDQGLLEVFRALESFASNEALSCLDDAGRCSVTQPVLIVGGNEDQIISVDSMRALADMLPNATLRVIPACGHCPAEEKPQRLLHEIARWKRIHGL
ncbi:Lipase LipV [Porphyridium purpureum]|uniref:Lipase LipV n=1 Tax=Porphyridium purpureum TaxID=35688 RepID=A0A5J4YI64_PORPP|nr:Lipase LipV [Porphyridium purpureum]|eukprot:POR0671..scf289_17